MNVPCGAIALPIWKAIAVSHEAWLSPHPCCHDKETHGRYFAGQVYLQITHNLEGSLFRDYNDYNPVSSVSPPETKGFFP